MQQMRLTFRAWVELIALAVIWGGSFLAFEVLLREMGVLTLVAHRVFWAAVLLWIIAWRRGLAVPRKPAIWGAFLVMGLLNNAIPFGLIAYGQQSIESGLAAILNATTAFWGVTLSALFFADECLSANRIAGVGIGIAGLVIVIGPQALSGIDPRSLGQLAVVGATLSYAFAGIWARKRLVGLSPVVSSAGMLTGSSLIMVPLALLIDGEPSLTLLPETWWAVAYISVIATAGAYLLYYRVLAMAGSGNLMLVTILVSPIAVILGAVVLGEALSPLAFTGFGVIALGMLVLDGRLLAWIAPGQRR